MDPRIKRAQLTIQMKLCADILKEYLRQIKNLENDNKISVNDKVLKLKKINVELSKVSQEIDSAKKEIKLLIGHDLN